MGDFADEATFWPDDLDHYLVAEMKPPKTWTTQYGEVLKIKKMQTPHVLNCMSMLYRNGQRDLPHYEAFKRELVKRDFA